MIELTPHEQYFLELVNRARLNPEQEANRYNIDLNENLAQETITSQAKQPLASNSILLEAARNHSQWILDTDTFSHTGVNGTSPAERGENAGYPSNFIGENLGWQGTSGEINDLTSFVDELHEGLFLSPSHRLNLMRSDYEEIGLGILTGEFTDDGTDWNAVITTHDFGAELNNDSFFITGVIYEDLIDNHFYDPSEGVSNITVEVVNPNNDFSATTTTKDAGGYELAVPSGEYEVKFTGEALETTVTEVVTVEENNLKIDVRTKNEDGAAIAEAVTLNQEPLSVQTPLDQDEASTGEITLDQDSLNFQTPLSQFRSGATNTDWVRANPNQVALGERLITDAITVTNSGEGELTLQEIQLPDVEGLTPETTFADNEVLASGESKTYRFGFNPIEAGINLEGEQITIITDDPTQSEINVSLFGRSTFATDLSYDGRVNLNDLGRLSAHFGTSEGDDNYDPSADINFDGGIDTTDLDPLSAEFGSVL